MLTPPSYATKQEPVAREIIFVIDTSGSMGGESIRQARDSLALAVQRLQPSDNFNIIRFSDQTDQLFSRAQPATAESVAGALGYIAALEARGGTMMLPALQAALQNHAQQTTRLRQVIFLTDGAIGNEQQLFETISAERGDARIFTVGIGSAPNSYFMSRAAELGQGAFTHIGAVGEVASRMGALFEKLESPAITNLALNWPAGVQVETWPSPIPDLYNGETLVVAARANSAQGTLQISGLDGETHWKVALPLEGAANRKGVSKLWARKKIASLELSRAQRAADPQTIDKEILDVALAHSLISRMTSLVAVDVTPSRPADEDVTRADLPLNLPHGWDFEKVFGESEPAPRQREAAAGNMQLLAAKSKPAALAQQTQPGVALPQGATLADIKLLRGMGLVFLAIFLLFLALRPQVLPLPADAKRDVR